MAWGNGLKATDPGELERAQPLQVGDPVAEGGVPVSEDVIEQIAEHLGFLGFEVEITEKHARARHPRRYNFTYKRYNGGILFTAFFTCTDRAREERAGFLELVNLMNSKAGTVRFYIDEDHDLLLEAWYPGAYQRVAFGQFMDLWERDCELLSNDSNDYIR